MAERRPRKRARRVSPAARLAIANWEEWQPPGNAPHADAHVTPPTIPAAAPAAPPSAPPCHPARAHTGMFRDPVDWMPPGGIVHVLRARECGAHRGLHGNYHIIKSVLANPNRSLVARWAYSGPTSIQVECGVVFLDGYTRGYSLHKDTMFARPPESSVATHGRLRCMRGVRLDGLSAPHTPVWVGLTRKTHRLHVFAMDAHHDGNGARSWPLLQDIALITPGTDETYVALEWNVERVSLFAASRMAADGAVTFALFGVQVGHTTGPHAAQPPAEPLRFLAKLRVSTALLSRGVEHVSSPRRPDLLSDTVLVPWTGGGGGRMVDMYYPLEAVLDACETTGATSRGNDTPITHVLHHPPRPIGLIEHSGTALATGMPLQMVIAEGESHERWEMVDVHTGWACRPPVHMHDATALAPTMVQQHCNWNSIVMHCESRMTLFDVVAHHDDTTAGRSSCLYQPACTRPLGALRQPMWQCVECSADAPDGMAVVCIDCMFVCHHTHTLRPLGEHVLATCTCVGAQCVLCSDPPSRAAVDGAARASRVCVPGCTRDGETHAHMERCVVCERFYHTRCLNLDDAGLPLPRTRSMVCGACVPRVDVTPPTPPRRAVVLSARDASDALSHAGIGNELLIGAQAPRGPVCYRLEPRWQLRAADVVGNRRRRDAFIPVPRRRRTPVQRYSGGGGGGTRRRAPPRHTPFKRHRGGWSDVRAIIAANDTRSTEGSGSGSGSGSGGGSGSAVDGNGTGDSAGMVRYADSHAVIADVDYEDELNVTTVAAGEHIALLDTRTGDTLTRVHTPVMIAEPNARSLDDFSGVVLDRDTLVVLSTNARRSFVQVFRL